VLFDIGNYRKYLCLSSNWHFLVREGVGELFRKVEHDFVHGYYQHLAFNSAYTSSSIMHAGSKRGIRVDRVMVCEVISPDVNNCLKASYTYEMLGSKSRKQAAVFKIDVIPRSVQRVTWIHLDQREGEQPQTQPIT
jgi:hypothetical protein